MLIADGARASVVRAMSEARARGATHVDTGHLLMGILARDDTAMQGIWRQVGIDPAALRTALSLGAGCDTGRGAARWHGVRARRPAAGGARAARLRPVAFTAGARGVLGDALVRAQQRHARTLGAADLLLAIATRGSGTGRGDLFAALACDAAPMVHDAVRAATVATTGASPAPAGHTCGSTSGRGTSSTSRSGSR